VAGCQGNFQGRCCLCHTWQGPSRVTPPIFVPCLDDPPNQSH
jgi:hypothetical protein